MPQFEPLCPGFGLEAHDVDVSRPLSTEAFAEVERAFYRGQVLVLRGQSLSPAQFVDFARRLGPPQPHVIDQFHHPEDPNILILSNVKKDGEPTGLQDAGSYFHTDYSYLQVPARATTLYSIVVPKKGGDTLFANQQAAYDDLPEAMKRRIEPLHGVHHYGNRHDTDERSRTVASPLTAEQKAKLPLITHRLARPHPVTGRKSLYAVSGSSFGIVGMPDDEALDLLDELAAHSTQPKYRYSLKYGVGDVVIWDNASLLHSATLIDPDDARTLWRITVLEPAPIGMAPQVIAPAFAPGGISSIDRPNGGAAFVSRGAGDIAASMVSIPDARVVDTMNRPPGWQRAAHNIAAMRELAKRALPRPIFDFADGGAETEWTLRRNEAAFGDVALVPRPLRGAGERDLSLTLFGSRLSMPLLIGPTGLAGLFAPGGEEAAARAAAAAGTGYCLSHGSVCTLEALAALATSPRWMQVFVYKDRAFTREMIDRAATARYDALVLTVDNQLMGNRERDVRNGFGIPPRFSALQLLGMARQLPWLWRMRYALPRLTLGNYVRPGSNLDFATLAGRLASLLDPALNWDDVREIRERWRGTLLLKGILHPDEAMQAARLGVDGIIVSNHGGRQLDGAISSIEALPAIVAAVGSAHPDVAILIDGGIRRGTDVVKALALGARAALIGRPQLWGLAVAGEAGVAHVLDIYRREIDRAMGLLGAARLGDIGPELLARVGVRDDMHLAEGYRRGEVQGADGQR